MSWEQLSVGVELPFDPQLVVPELHEYPLDVPSPPAVADIERGAYDAALNTFRDAVTPGMTVAVGGGSRGFTGRVELLRGTLAALRELGAQPFVVPAMGSHGGATAPGQIHMLESLGMTEETLGCEIRATMDTVVIAHTGVRHAGPPRRQRCRRRSLPAGQPDQAPHVLQGADRVGLHEDGGGRVRQAARRLPRPLVRAGRDARSPARRLRRDQDDRAAAGRHRVDRIDVRRRRAHRGPHRRRRRRRVRARAHRVRPDARAGAAVRRDRRADRRARRQGHLGHHDRPQRHRSVLGATVSTTCRSRACSAIVLLELTDVSDGNALGIGFADFIPASLANKLDFRKTYINCFTAGPAGMRRSRMPMVLPDEEVVHQGRAVDVRPRADRTEAGRADQVDLAPHRVLGQRRAPALGIDITDRWLLTASPHRLVRQPSRLPSGLNSAQMPIPSRATFPARAYVNRPWTVADRDSGGSRSHGPRGRRRTRLTSNDNRRHDHRSGPRDRLLVAAGRLGRDLPRSADSLYGWSAGGDRRLHRRRPERPATGELGNRADER